MSANIYKEFCSTKNLRLAWERVVRSKHRKVKNRISLRKYSVDVERNLNILSDKLVEGVYEPTSAYTKMIPKKNGSLRSLSYLTIEDRIVYQAIVNKISEKGQADIVSVEDRQLFGHIPNNDSLFAVKKWQEKINKFEGRYENMLRSGKRWVLESDISSFYSSIDHEALSEIITQRWINNSNLIQLFKKCLKKWSSYDGHFSVTTGIPQGYEASDILATMFLVPVDEKISRNFNYIRYVDDIRIVAGSRERAMRGLAELDMYLKKHSLSIQTKKTAIKKVVDVDKEKEKISKKLSKIDSAVSRGDDVENELMQLFFDANANLDSEEDNAESELAFSLYRMKKHPAVKEVAIDLLSELPWRTDIINYYLKNFNGDRGVISRVRNEIENHSIYSHHLATCLRTLSSISNVDIYKDIPRRWLVRHKQRWPQRLAAVESLERDFNFHAALRDLLREEDNIFVKQSLYFVLVFQAYESKNIEEVKRLISSCLGEESESLMITGIWILRQVKEVTWIDINFDGNLGPYKKLIPSIQEEEAEYPCFIKQTFRKEYDASISEKLDFRDLLPDYSGTVKELRRLQPYYETDPNIYIILIDSFNHSLSIALKNILYPGIDNDDYVNMVEAMKNDMPTVMSQFEETHNMRSKLRGSHAFSSSMSDWSLHIGHSRKEEIYDGLCIAYQNMVNFLEE